MIEKRITKLCFLNVSLLSIITLLCYGIINSTHFKKYISSDISESLLTSMMQCKTNGKKLSKEFWRKVDLLTYEIPQALKSKSWSIVLKQNDVVVNNTVIHYRSVQPSEYKKENISVLLLHGQAFSSATWENLGTLRLLGRLGYYGIAIDLPGFGESPGAIIYNKGHFLKEIIDALGMKKLVIVSPSMSGDYSLPYVLHYWQTLLGFVPISPVNTAVLKEICNEKVVLPQKLDRVCENLLNNIKGDWADLSCIKVPTMVVFGQRDQGLNSAQLCQLPWSQGFEIPQGTHAAYLDDPELWHKALYNFLHILEETYICK